MSSQFLVQAEGDEVTALGSTYRAKTDGAHVAMAYSAMEEEFWGDTTPLHSHTDAEEAFYVLSGRLEVWVEGQAATAAVGAFIVVPRGAVHGLRGLSSEPVRMLTLVSPPGFEQFFTEVAEQGEEQLLAEPDRLLALARKYGTEIIGDYPAPSSEDA